VSPSCIRRDTQGLFDSHPYSCEGKNAACGAYGEGEDGNEVHLAFPYDIFTIECPASVELAREERKAASESAVAHDGSALSEFGEWPRHPDRQAYECCLACMMQVAGMTKNDGVQGSL
jgi:hypothetical protein